MKKIALVLVMGWAVNGWSEDTGAAFLKISPSVKGEALGGINPAGTQGAQALGVNPGNLALMKGSEFTSGAAMLIGESTYGTAGIALQRGKRAAVGAHVTYLQSGQLEGRDSNGNISKSFSARDMAAGLSIAVGSDRIRAGITAKAVKQEIGEAKSDAVPAADAGIGLKTGPLNWGIAALNVGGKIGVKERKSALPAIYSLGASVPVGGGMTILAGGAQIAGETTASLGVEYSLKGASLRLGYRSEGGENLAKSAQKSGDQALGGLSGGIGVDIKSFRLDYAVSQAAVEYGMSHRAAITIGWGGEERQEGESGRVGERKKKREIPEAKKEQESIEPKKETAVEVKEEKKEAAQESMAPAKEEKPAPAAPVKPAKKDRRKKAWLN